MCIPQCLAALAWLSDRTPQTWLLRMPWIGSQNPCLPASIPPILVVSEYWSSSHDSSILYLCCFLTKFCRLSLVHPWTAVPCHAMYTLSSSISRGSWTSPAAWPAAATSCKIASHLPGLSHVAQPHDTAQRGIKRGTMQDAAGVFQDKADLGLHHFCAGVRDALHQRLGLVRQQLNARLRLHTSTLCMSKAQYVLLCKVLQQQAMHCKLCI